MTDRGPYREPAPLSPQVAIAVDSLRQAKILIGSYRTLVHRLGFKNLLSGTKYDPDLTDLDDRLGAMDQDYAGAWEKLDEARELLLGEGYDVSRYDDIRSQVINDFMGFEEEHSVEHKFMGTEHRSKWWVNPEQVQLPTVALEALSAGLPPTVSLEMEPDSGWDDYIKGERGGNRLWKLGVWLLVLGVLVGLFWLVCGRCYA